MKRWLLAGGMVYLMLALGAGSIVLAQATNTPTYTATWNNRTRQAYATIPFASNCDPFNPCGAFPWMIPRFPTVNLASPTAIPTLPTPTPVPASATPSYTNTPTDTPTPTYTPTGTIATPAATIAAGGESIATLADELGSYAGTLSAQASREVLIDNTPTGPEEIANNLGQYAGMFFGVVRAFQSLNSYTFGIFGFLLVVMGFVLMVTVITLIGNLILGFVRLILEIWSSIKPL